MSVTMLTLLAWSSPWNQVTVIAADSAMKSFAGELRVWPHSLNNSCMTMSLSANRACYVFLAPSPMQITHL